MFAFLATLSFSIYLVSSTDCDDYFECEFQTISDIANCYGYGSCVSTTINNDNSVHCDGCHSCYLSSITSNENIFCRSVSACNTATLITSSEVYCEGLQSCANSNINGNSQSKIYSYGHYSCANSLINNPSTVRGYGYYSLLYSTITSSSSSSSSNNNKMIIKAFGIDSGYGSNIICEYDSTCIVECKSSGCINLDFICLNGAICSVLPEQCLMDNSIDSYQGIDCPNWKVSYSDDDDNEFNEYIKQKDIDKENDIKWKLYQKYIINDIELYEIRKENSNINQNKMVINDINLIHHGANIYSYLIAAFISFLCITMLIMYYCGSKDYEYQKM